MDFPADRAMTTATAYPTTMENGAFLAPTIESSPLYTFPGGAASPVTTVGEDGKPGIAGVDDDGDGTIDKGIGELGAPGSDDLNVLAFTPSSSGPFLLVSSRFASQFAGFMPQDRSPGADGKPGTTDDEFSPAQLAALDVRVAAEADELLAAIQADYAPISDGLILQRDNADADVVMDWSDLGPGLFGHTSAYDRNLAKMQELIGTPGRTDPITGNTYNLDMPDVAQQWALAEYINENLADTGEFAVGINLDFTNPTTTFAQYVSNTVSHELGHTFGLNEGYFSEGTVPADIDGHRGERPGGGTAQVRADGNAFPYDIMSNGQLGDGDLTFKPPTVQLLQAATGTQGNSDLPLTDALNLWRNGFYLVNGTYPDDGHDQNGIREESKNPSTVPEIYVTAGEDFFFGAGGETAAIGSAPADGAGERVRRPKLHADQ